MAAVNPETTAKERISTMVYELFLRGNVVIPSLNAHAVTVMNSANRIMQADITELVILLRADPASAAELLRTANSALYRRSSEISSLEDAIIRIGRREAYAVMATLATRSLFEPGVKKLQQVMPNQWFRQHQHSVVSAFAAAWLGAKLNIASYERSFWAGMFHDIGTLGALSCLCTLIADGKVPEDIGSELAGPILQDLHVKVGHKMLSTWQLPGDVAAICLRHHASIDPKDGLYKMIQAVNVVSCLDMAHNGTYVPDTLEKELEVGLESLNLRPHEMIEKVKAITDHVNRLLSPVLTNGHLAPA